MALKDFLDAVSVNLHWGPNPGAAFAAQARAKAARAAEERKVARLKSERQASFDLLEKISDSKLSGVFDQLRDRAGDLPSSVIVNAINLRTKALAAKREREKKKQLAALQQRAIKSEEGLRPYRPFATVDPQARFAYHLPTHLPPAMESQILEGIRNVGADALPSRMIPKLEEEREAIRKKLGIDYTPKQIEAIMALTVPPAARAATVQKEKRLKELKADQDVETAKRKAFVAQKVSQYPARELMKQYGIRDTPGNRETVIAALKKPGMRIINPPAKLLDVIAKTRIARSGVENIYKLAKPEYYLVPERFKIWTRRQMRRWFSAPKQYKKQIAKIHQTEKKISEWYDRPNAPDIVAESAVYWQEVEHILGAIRHDRFGGALTQTEAKFFELMSPTVKQPYGAAVAMIKALGRTLARKEQAYTRTRDEYQIGGRPALVDRLIKLKASQDEKDWKARLKKLENEKKTRKNK